MNRPEISKSQYIKWLQCPKALWFYHYRKDLKQPVDLTTQSRFDVGNEVGQLGKQYFNCGVEVAYDCCDIEKVVASTKEFIKQGQDIVFEAAAIHPIDYCYSRIDVLYKVPEIDEWDLTEIKSSTDFKDYHIEDMSFQYYVFCGAGYKIRKCSIMVIDNAYVREGDIDPQKLFKLKDISDEVLVKQGDIPHNLEQIRRTIDSKDEPDVQIGQRCSSPFECEYRYHCWKDIPKYSIFDIYQKKKARDIINQIGSYDIKDIPLNLFPSGYKAIDINCYQEDKRHVEKEQLREWLKKLEYPLYYLGYETINPAIPLFDGTRSYQQIPFQFSLHVQEAPNSVLKHFEFIHKEQSDPREAFVKALVAVCRESGSVIVYNQSFEMSRNKELADDFPQYADELLAINKRVVDLLAPFKKRWIYSPKQKSSASIKHVLPAFTNLKYEGLDITNGEEAGNVYLTFAKGNMTAEELYVLWGNLSEYCKLDTYGMVELLEILKKKIKEVG